MTALTERPVPDDYELGELRSSQWRVGCEFRWSEFYEAYLPTSYRFTVRPEETIGEAYERETGQPLPSGNEAFFNINE